MLSGCVSKNYRMIKAEDKIPPVAINASFATAEIAGTLNTLITYQGPGAWKREALWDEYVFTIRNPGTETTTITEAFLIDHAGEFCAPGEDPWVLQKQSRTREERYRDAGVAFVRYTAPGVVILGAGTAAVVSAGVLSTGAATAATVTVVALPIYYLAVVGINMENKAEVKAEYNRRRVHLPLTLGPGAAATGSLFFPMVVSPRELQLRWQRGKESGQVVLPLEFLRGLHVKEPGTPARVNK